MNEYFRDEEGNFIDLSRYDEEYSGIKPEARGPVPDGTYQVNVEKAELAMSQSRNPMLKWQLRIIAPEFIGRIIYKHNMLSTSDNLKWLKTDLLTCGLELQLLSDLQQNLGRLLNCKLEITKKTKGEFENVYFNRLLTVTQEPSGWPITREEDLAF
jgi:hypothetical protein